MGSTPRLHGTQCRVRRYYVILAGQTELATGAAVWRAPGKARYQHGPEFRERLDSRRPGTAIEALVRRSSSIKQLEPDCATGGARGGVHAQQSVEAGLSGVAARIRTICRQRWDRASAGMKSRLKSLIESRIRDQRRGQGRSGGAEEALSHASGQNLRCSDKGPRGSPASLSLR
jgi:hypothetical protein